MLSAEGYADRVFKRFRTEGTAHRELWTEPYRLAECWQRPQLLPLLSRQRQPSLLKAPGGHNHACMLDVAFIQLLTLALCQSLAETALFALSLPCIKEYHTGNFCLYLHRVILPDQHTLSYIKRCIS